METIRRAGLFAGAMLLGCGAVHADNYDWEDIFAPSRQRIDTATTSSGNAQNVNAATQIITPWPRNVFNRRILGDGAPMVGAVERYREPGAQAKAVGSPAQPRTVPGAGESPDAANPAKTGTAGQSEQPKQ